ncbi:tRNA(His) guanylyltransferase Thg1 family protein [uncultured Clostridium sp.]|uniref:tRNA(His) guanylyltransferase Thg1 family protein n=1 Tax=uncultured Clostridium sp. TaxID=59620 RepID=UPI0026F33672|nr:tRNA(His) guanylyltransferase Thg1 family protein [uncultured Clostridium sp.]
MNKIEIQKLSDSLEMLENDKRQRILGTQPIIIKVTLTSVKEFTKNLFKPNDSIYRKTLEETMLSLCKGVNFDCRLGYTTYNEIILIILPRNSQGLLNLVSYNQPIDVLTSSISSMATNYFNSSLLKEIEYQEKLNKNRQDKQKLDLSVYKNLVFKAIFKVKVFNIPKEYLYDYIYLKHINNISNSLELTALSTISEKERVGKNNSEVKALCKEKGVDFDSLSRDFRFGTLCTLDVIDNKKKYIKILLTRPLKRYGKDKENIEHLINVVDSSNYTYRILGGM